MNKLAFALGAAFVFASGAAFAQQAPGAPDTSRITGGTYQADPNHTQAIFSVDHMGFSTLTGIFGQATGTLTLDPKSPASAKLEIEFPVKKVSVTAEKFAEHLASNELLDSAKFPTATFKSTTIEVSGEKAKVTGDLTLHGVTKPVTLDVVFVGAGVNPMSKKETIGFSATAKVNRSDFGLGAFVPVVSDQVDLKIAGAFEK